MFYYLLIFIVLFNKMTRKSKYSILLHTAIQQPPQKILNFGATLNLGREIEQSSERGDQKLQNHISLEFVKEYLVVQIWQNMFNELNIPYFCTPLYLMLLLLKNSSESIQQKLLAELRISSKNLSNSCPFNSSHSAQYLK